MVNANDNDIIAQAAERAEMSQIVGKPLEPWELMRDTLDLLYRTCGYDLRVPTNPATYHAKGKDL